MNLRKRFAFPSIILIFGLLLSGCNLTGQAPVQTVDPIALQATVDAAVAQALLVEALKLTGTAAALPTNAFTATATLEPTFTSTPEATATATASPQPTATVQYIVVTNTYIPPTQKPSATPTSAAYVCSLISTTPATGTKMSTYADFDAVWKVKNTGSKDWQVGYVDLQYVSGTKMQTVADVFDVNTAVLKGAELTLIVDMKSPGTAGKYTESFALIMEGTTMCVLPLNIEVTP